MPDRAPPLQGAVDWSFTTVVPGAPSVMTTGPLLRPVWPAGPWASLEPGLPTPLPTLGPDRDRSGWTTCSAMECRNRSAVELSKIN